MNSKLHDEIRISLYKSSSHGEERLLIILTLASFMKWSGMLLNHENPNDLMETLSGCDYDESDCHDEENS